MPLDYDKVMPIIKSVAKSVTSKFPPYVQEDDTLGALLLWVYQNRSQVERALEDGPGWEAKISSSLRKVAFDHCNSEKAASEGYDPDSVYRYQVDVIRAIIPIALDYHGWQQYDAWDESVSLNRREHFGLAEIIDVKNGLAQLPEDTKKVLVFHFWSQYTPQQLGDALGVSPGTARKRVQRAVKALQKQLGYKESSETPGTGRKPRRSNAAARAELSNLYEG